MIHLHATKKLYAKLPLDDHGCLATKKAVIQANTPATANNPLSGWHGNLITLQRRNCVLLVHDASRFPLFIKGLVKADFANFNWHFADSLMNTLLKLGANQQQLDAAAALLAPCQFDTQCDRSVQGSLNNMKANIEHMLWVDDAKLEDISSYKTGVWLAEMPSRVMDYTCPSEAMLTLLSQPAPDGSTTTQTAARPDIGPGARPDRRPDNVVQLADHRRKPNV